MEHILNFKWEVFEPILQWLGLLSLFTFVLSLAVIPWLISKLSPDYFIRHIIAPQAKNTEIRFRNFYWFVARNLVGGMLFLAGLAMLFLPGQGILTIIIGISLMAFPGKHRFLAILTRKSAVQNALDWMRIKTGRQTFNWPEKASASASHQPPHSSPKNIS
jgi:hypothetical protein